MYSLTYSFKHHLIKTITEYEPPSVNLTEINYIKIKSSFRAIMALISYFTQQPLFHTLKKSHLMPSIFSNLSRNLASANIFTLAQSVILSGWHAFAILHLQCRRQRWARDLGRDPGLSTGILTHSFSPRTPGAPSFCCLYKSFYWFQQGPAPSIWPGIRDLTHR